MINKVKILSANTYCRRTKRIVNSLDKFFKENNIEAEFTIISNLDEILKYRTWILPTIIINETIVAKGCRPSNEKILNSIK